MMQTYLKQVMEGGVSKYQTVLGKLVQAMS